MLLMTKDYSITDLIEALAASFGAIGLIWTLYLQRKTTNEQIRIREIEQERDKRAILPYFAVAIVPSDFISAGLNLRLKITLKQNAVTLAVFESVNNPVFKIHLSLDSSRLYPEESKEYFVEYLEKAFIPYTNVMRIRFADTGLNFYYQDVFINNDGISISYPNLDYEDMSKNAKPTLRVKVKDFLKKIF